LKQCTDGNACNGIEECVPATGACVPGAEPVCNNGDSCPDTCDPEIGCVEAPCTSSTIPNINQAPVCDSAFADPDGLHPANHKLVPVHIGGVVDPDGDSVSIDIVSVYQDEPLDEGKRALACADGGGIATSTAWVRAERRRKGDGRMYEIRFIAKDGRGKSCEGTAHVCVPRDKKGTGECGDQGPLVEATTPLCDGTCRLSCDAEGRVARLTASCNDGPLPKYVEARIAQSQALVAKGSGLVGRGRSQRMISAGIKMLQKTARSVFKAEREGTITPDCSTLLTDKLQEAKAAAEGVIAELTSPTS
jgi:hypothetical protein